MGIFDALNARILAAVDVRSGVSRLACAALANDRLVLTLADGGVQELQWAGLRRVVALRRDLHAGDEVSLLLEFDPAEIVEIPASVPGWTALATSVDSLEGARRFGEWHVEVLAAPMGHGTPVWSREDASTGHRA